MKKGIKIGIGLILGLSLVASPGLVFADGMGKKADMEQQGLDEKIFHKAKMMFLFQKELGLSDKQVDKIKGLKYSVKKSLIEQDAQIDLIKVDIKQELWQPKIDVKKINKLVDKKYDLKRERAKYLVKSYADLKDILNKDQKEKLMDMYIEKKKKMSCPMMADMKKMMGGHK
jgi:Spy/CpxP family protein refolding chaperone